GAHPSISPTEALEAFQNGRLGMVLTTSALQGTFLRAAQGRWDLRAGGMPAFGNNPVRPTNSGAALMILTDDPVKQRAAWELIKFLTSERGYTVLTSVMGYLPLRPSTVNDPQYLQDFVRRNPQILPNLAQLDQLEPWVPFPGPNYGQMRNIMMQAVEQAVLGPGDARAIMTDAQQRASALMPRR
ncbi:MAG: extracellular solute-binding protein, partial [Dehalococcoidia bacterium]|nr:extracellular solute-binding protein [Dehalococcoidia bacterium]